MAGDHVANARAALAPTGVLRVTINLGNPVIAYRDRTGALGGISVVLARMLAEELQAPLEFCIFDTAANAVSAVETGVADIGFFARDPTRAARIAFTEPYLLIEGCYLVRKASTLQSIAEVDAPGTRLTVGQGSAYDLFLSREIRYAKIERAPTSPAVVEHFLRTEADVAAGVRQQLESDAARIGELRLLAGRFMVIEQAIGVARSHGSVALQVLDDFVQRVRAANLVAET